MECGDGAVNCVPIAAVIDLDQVLSLTDQNLILLLNLTRPVLFCLILFVLQPIQILLNLKLYPPRHSV